MQYDIIIPRLNTNEDEVLVADIPASEGQRVDVGDELLVLETSKAAVAIEAECPGFVRRILVESGDMVAVGARAMVLADTLEEPLGAEPGGEAQAPPETEGPQRTGPTAKERLLLRRAHGGGRGVGQSVVLPVRPSAPIPEPTPSAELDFVRRARALLAGIPETADGQMFELAPGNTGSGPGYVVAPSAVVASDALIRARRVYLAEGAAVGAGVFIEADAVFIGPMAKVGAQARMVSGEIVLAEGSYVGEDVEVDLGGGRSAESRLLVGPASLVSPRSWVNTCREVVLEEESALSPGSYVFTHRFWQSVLDGYAAVFAGVRLCRGSWVGAGCQIMAGVVLGEGSIAVSNSTVVDSVPPGAMVAGIPAKVIRESLRRELPDAEKFSVLQGVLEEFAEHLKFKNCTVEPAGHGLGVVLPGGVRRAVVLVPPGEDARVLEAGCVAVSFGPLADVSPDVSLFDLGGREFSGPEDRLSHELRNFLRRRGIRLRPFAWDGSYRHGI